MAIKSSKMKNLYPLVQGLLVAICVFIIWASATYWIMHYGPNHASKALEAKGQFGDSFGMVNSLFSGLAFAGIIFTIILQRKELKLQRQELELTRQELARSAKAQELSQMELKKQANNLRQSARLNALASMIDHFRREEENCRLQHNKRGTIHAIEKQKEYFEIIEGIFHEK